MTKYMPKENENKLRKLLQACKNKDPQIKFWVLDSEGTVYKGSDIEELIEEVDGIDDEMGINLYQGNFKGDCLGWIGIIPEEEDGIGYDYTDNELCNELLKTIED